jgi:hypothetical protein
MTKIFLPLKRVCSSEFSVLIGQKQVIILFSLAIIINESALEISALNFFRIDLVTRTTYVVPDVSEMLLRTRLIKANEMFLCLIFFLACLDK